MQSFTPEVQKRFKYWQMRTLIATMIGYALFYFVRKNFSLAMPGLEADLGISKTSLGIFLTLNGLVYGLSRFVNGIPADRLNARFFMATGLALCALANFAFGFGVDVSEWITGESSGSQFNNTLILFMGVMWVVNGMLQGTGFPPCARLLTHWIPPKELATQDVGVEHLAFDRRGTGRHPLRLHHEPHGYGRRPCRRMALVLLDSGGHFVRRRDRTFHFAARHAHFGGTAPNLPAPRAKRAGTLRRRPTRPSCAARSSAIR